MLLLRCALCLAFVHATAVACSPVATPAAAAPQPRSPPDTAIEEPPCPPGMVLVDGGTFTLGEWDESTFVTGFHGAVIELTEFELQPYCIDLYPFPGEPGDTWPCDGLNWRAMAAFDEAIAEFHRRPCSVGELLLAAAGPDNWRYPYDPEELRAGVCEPSDLAPESEIGSYRECYSPLGLYEFIVRSTWGFLENDTLRARLASLSEEPLPAGGLYAVQGGTSRDATFYASTNFGIHFHGVYAVAHNDDGARTCTMPYDWDPQTQEAWADFTDGFRVHSSFQELLGIVYEHP